MENLKFSIKVITISILLIFVTLIVKSQIAVPNKTVCSPADAITLDAIDPAPSTGLWTTGTGAGIANETLFNSVVTNLTAGVTAVFTWTVGASSWVQNVTNNELVAVAGSNKDACFTTQLEAVNPTPGKGYWTSSSSQVIFDNTTLSNATVSNLPKGQAVTFTWTVVNGSCSNSADVIITDKTPVGVDAGSYSQVCNGNEVQLNGSLVGGQTGKWELTGGSGIFDNTALAATWIRNLDPNNINTIKWTVTENACSDSDIATITNNTVFAVNNATKSEVCSSTVTLKGSSTPVGAAGSWSVFSSSATISNSNSNTATANGLNYDLNTFTWTVTKGNCTNSINIKINNNTVEDINAGETTSVCKTTTNLNGQDLSNPPYNGSTGVWTVVGTAKVTSTTKWNSGVTNLESEIKNTFTWTVTKGTCIGDNFVNIINNKPIAETGADKPNECGTTNNLSANNPDDIGATGLWSVEDGGTAQLTDEVLYNSTVTDLQNGINKFKWTVTKETCTSEAYMEITTLIANAGNDQPNVCKTAILTASPTTGTWSVEISTGSPSFSNETFFNTTVSKLGEGANKLRWTVTNGSCDAFDDVIITNDEVIAKAGPDKVRCDGNTTIGTDDWLSLAGNDVGDGTWTVISTNGANPQFYSSGANDYNTRVKRLNHGKNVFQWSVNKNGCISTDRVTFTNLPRAQVDNTRIRTCDDFTQLNGNEPKGGKGFWFKVSGGKIETVSLYNSNVTSLQPYLNSFIWTITTNNGSACNGPATVTVYNFKPQGISAGPDQPNACETADLSATELVQPPAAIVGGTETGKWTGSGTFAPVASPITQVSNLSIGATELTWTVTRGDATLKCVDSKTVTITNIGTDKANAGTDQFRCSSTATLAPIGATVGTWKKTNGTGSVTNATLYNTTVTGIPQGQTTTFTWTLKNGSCESTDEVEITNNMPTTSIAGADKPNECSEPVTLGANTPTTGTGAWYTGGAGVVYDNSTNPGAKVSGLTAGDNVFTWIITKGACSSESHVTITYAEPINVEAGTNQDDCKTSFTMTANPAASGIGQWSKILGPGTPNYADQTLATTVVSGLQKATYKFNWTVTDGACTGDDEVTIINSSLVDAEAGTVDPVCGTTAQLNATPPSIGKGEWSTLAPTVTIDKSTLFNTTVSGLEPGTTEFIWSVTNNGCLKTDKVFVKSNKVTTSDAGTPDVVNVCKKNRVLSGTPPTFGVGKWETVTGGATFDLDSKHNATAILTLGENKLKWTITNGDCTSEDIITINNYEVTADAGDDKAVCEDVSDWFLQGNDPITQDIVFPTTTVTATGTWSTTSGTIIDDQSYNTTLTDLKLDINTFTWTITNGVCTDSKEVKITNNTPTIPNAGPDRTICSRDHTLEGNDPANPGPARGIGQWTLQTGNTTFIDPTSQHDAKVTDLAYYAQKSGPDHWTLEPTVNVFRWTITYKGCTSYDEVEITNAMPLPANAGVDQTVCRNEVTFNALDKGSGAQTSIWSLIAPNPTTPPGNGISISNAGTFNAHAKDLSTPSTDPPATVEHTFRWTKTNIINGVTCVDWDEVKIFTVAANGVTSAGSNDAVCSTEYNLKASSPDMGFPSDHNVTGEWTVILGRGTFDNTSINDTWIRNLGYRKNILRWTVTDHDLACINTSDVDIRNDLPSTPNGGADHEVCENRALLSADRPTRGSGEWSVAGGGGTISDMTCQDYYCNVYATNLGQGTNTFLWTTTYTGATTCKLEDNVYVENNTITAETDVNNITCDDFYTIGANQPGTSTGFWNKIGGSGIIQNSLSKNTLVTGLSKDINTFRWTLSNGKCEDYNDINITSNKPTSPTANTPLANICTDVASITGNQPEINGGSGQWSVHSGGGDITDDTQRSTTVTGIPIGFNEYKWTITKKGCPLDAIVAVTNKTVKADANVDIVDICGTEALKAEVQLNAVSPGTGETGEWTPAGGPSGTIETPTLFNTWIRTINDGISQFRWRISNGTCSHDDIMSVTVYIPTTANLLPESDKVCAALANHTDLKGNVIDDAKESGLWEQVSGETYGTIVSPTSVNTTVYNLGYNTSVFSWTIDRGGCTSTDTYTLINNNVVSVPGDNKAICEYDYTLKANDPTANDKPTSYKGSGKWTLEPLATGTFDSDTRYNAVISGLSTTNPNKLRWTVTKDNCSEHEFVTIVNNSFVIDAEVRHDPNEFEVCDDFAILEGEQPGGVATGEWKAQDAGTFVDKTLYNTRVNGLKAGTNTFIWTITNQNCTASDQVIVSNNKVVANAGTNNRRTCEDFETLDAGEATDGATGDWVVRLGGSAVTSRTLFNSGITKLKQGKNTFEWTITKGNCSDVKEIDMYSDKPDDAKVENDKDVCTNSSSLIVTTTPLIGIGDWAPVDNSATIPNSSAITANATGLNLGDNTFRWTVTENGCTSSDDLIITNNEVVATTGGSRSSNCETYISLLGNNPNNTQGTGEWIKLQGAPSVNIANSTLYNTSITGLGTDANKISKFKWTVTLGICTAEAEEIITNNAILAEAGNQGYSCGSTFSPLDGNDVASVGGTGEWESVGLTAEITDFTKFNSSVYGLDAGDNTFKWTVTANGCSHSDEVVITNNEVTAYAGTDQHICGETTTMKATKPVKGTGEWTRSTGAGTATFNTFNSPVTGLTSPTNQFKWTVTYTSGTTCTDDSFVILYNDTPLASNAGVQINLCQNNTTTLSANTPGAGEGDGLWHITKGSGLFSTRTSATATVSNIPIGQNKYKWTITKGDCSSETEIDVYNNTVVALVDGDGTTKTTSVCLTSTNLDANNPIATQGTGKWTNTGGTAAKISTNTIYNSLVTDLVRGENKFTWTVTQNTCTTSDELTVINNTVEANAGTTQYVCKTETNLDATDVSSKGATGEWSSIGNTAEIDNKTQFDTRVTGLDEGLNTFEWTVTSSTGCITKSQVEVYNSSVSAYAGSEQHICGTTATMKATDPTKGTGAWTNVSGSGTATLNTFNSPVTGLTSATNQFKWTVTYTSGTTCTDDSFVIIYNDTPVTSNAGVQINLCQANSTTLNANSAGAGEGKWDITKGSGVFNSKTLETALVSNIPIGQNTYKWTITKGNCSSESKIDVYNNTVVAKVYGDNSTETKNICETSTNLSANNPVATQGTGEWTNTGGTAAQIANKTLFNSLVTGLEQGDNKFTWTITMNGCNISDEITINNDLVTAEAGTAQAVCSTEADLNATDVSSKGATGKWISVGNTAIVITNSKFNSHVTGLDEGLNTFTWTVTSSSGCIISDNADVKNSLVTANAGTGFETCDASINLGAVEPNRGSGVWTPVSGNAVTIVDSKKRQSLVNGLSGGAYVFKWTVTYTDGTTCTNDANVTITNSSPQASNPSTTTPEVCDGNGVLNANGLQTGETGEWGYVDAAGTILSITSENTTVSGFKLGTNTFKWTISKGTDVTCTTTANIDIVNNKVVASTTGSPKTECSTTSSLLGNNPLLSQGSGEWIVNTSAKITNKTLYNSGVSELKYGANTFTWTVSKGVCTISADFVINNDVVEAEAGDAQAVCSTEADLNASDVSSKGATGKWISVGNTANVITESKFNSHVTGLDEGLNTFTWTVTSGTGCEKSDNVDVKNSLVTANAGLDIETCNSSVNLLADVPSKGIGIWTKVSGNSVVIEDSKNRQTGITGMTGGTYTFEWTVTNTDGTTCVDKSQMTVLNSNPQISNPSTTTPESCNGVGTLNALVLQSGETGLWKLDDAAGIIDNETSENTTVSGMKTGVNRFKWTITKGVATNCTNEATVSITNNEITATAAASKLTTCDATATLKGNVPIDGATGKWTVSSGLVMIDNTASNNTIASNLVINDNVFTWTVTKGGCEKSASVTIRNNKVTADAGDDESICESFTTFNANDPTPGTGEWTVENSPTADIHEKTLFNSTVYGLRTGTNVFKWTITENGCTDDDLVIITNDTVVISNGTTQYLCESNGTLSAGDVLAGNQTGEWTKTSNLVVIQSSLKTSTAVSNLEYGNNTFYWTVKTTSNCSSQVQYNIVNNSPSPAVIVGGPIVDCKFNATIQATTPVYGSGEWARISGLGNILQKTNNNTTVTGLSNTSKNTFSWTVTNEACTSISELDITNNSVTSNAGSKQERCQNSTKLAAVEPNVGIGSWTLSNGEGIIENSLLYNSDVTDIGQGDNVFTWSVVRGTCTAKSNVILVNNSPTEAKVGDKQEICENTTSLSGNLPAIGTGEWTVVGTKATITEATQYNTDIKIDIGATSTFTWTITQGICTTSADVVVTNNSFTVYAGKDKTLCKTNWTFEADNPEDVGTGSGGTGEWTIRSGSGIIDNTANYGATVSSLGADGNLFRWTITKNKCSAFDEVDIINKAVFAKANSLLSCESNATLDAQDPALQGSTGKWVSLSGTVKIDNTALFNSDVSNLSVGTNSFSWSITNGTCSYTLTPIVLNYYIPYSDAGASIPFACEADITLNANDPSSFGGTGQWTRPSGGPSVDILNDTQHNTSVKSLEIGNNKFDWTVTHNGCTSTSRVEIYNGKPLITIGPKQTLCKDNTTIAGKEPTITGSGKWDFISGSKVPKIENETLFSTTVTNLGTGPSVFKWTITDGGCNDFRELIIINNKPFPNAGEDDNDICINEVDLAAVDPGDASGVWSIVGDDGSRPEIFDNKSTHSTKVTNLTQGLTTFRWTVTNKKCTDSDDVQFTNNTPIVSAGGNKFNYCETDVKLQGSNPGSGTGEWSRASNTGKIENETLYNTNVTELENGVNQFTWTITEGNCTVSKTVTIETSIIEVNPGINVQRICNDSIEMQALKPSSGTGEWSAVNGGAKFDEASVNNTWAKKLSAYNKLKWTITDNGCTNSKDIEVYNDLPTKAVVENSGEKSVCESNTTITGNTPDYSKGETGEWSIVGVSNAKISDISAVTANVTNLDLGENKFRWTIKNASCDSYADLKIINNTVSANAGSYESICKNTYTLKAADLALGTTGEWKANGNSSTIVSSTKTETDVSNLDYGTNKFEWTVTGSGCTKLSVVVITNDKTTISDAGDKDDDCDGTYTLKGNSPLYGTGNWTRIGGLGKIVNPSLNNTTVTGLGNADNKFKWTITLNNCSSENEVIITNKTINVSAGVNDNVCGTSYDKLSGTIPTAGQKGEWSVDGGNGDFASESIYNTIVTNLDEGENQLKWTITEGVCSNSSTIKITNDTPTDAWVDINQTICKDNTTLKANSPTVGTGKWSRVGGIGFISDDTFYNTKVTALGAQSKFRWTITKGKCESIKDVSIENKSIEAITAGKTTSCGTTSTLSGNDPGSTGFWTKISGDGIIDNSNLNITPVTNLSTGENAFTWTVNNGTCSSMADMMITNNKYEATANLSGLSPICKNYIGVIGNKPTVGTGKWKVIAGSGIFDDETNNITTVRSLSEDNVTLQWTITKDNCENSADVSVTNNTVIATTIVKIVACGTESTLSGNDQKPAVGKWTRNSGTGIIDNSLDYNTAVTNLGTGDNSFTWTVTENGCSASADMIIRNDKYDAVANATGSTDICVNKIGLMANNPTKGSGKWTVEGGSGKFDDETANTTNVTEIKNGSSTYRWTVTKDGCPNYSDVKIINNTVEAKAGSDFIVCETTANLVGNNQGSGNGVWTAINGSQATFENSNINLTKVNNLGGGSNSLLWTITENGCTHSDEIVVKNNSFTTSAGDTKTICETSYTLTAADPSPGNGYWTIDGGSAVFTNKSSHATDISGLKSGKNTFRWTAVVDGCTAEDVVVINNGTYPANAGSDQDVCDYKATLSATQPTNGSGKWSLESGAGTFSERTIPNAEVTGIDLDKNTFRWTVTNGNCTSVNDVIITNNKVIQTAGMKENICQDYHTLKGDPAGVDGNGVWNVDGGHGVFENASLHNTKVTGLYTGNNTFRWTVKANNCEGSTTVIIANKEFTVNAGVKQIVSTTNATLKAVTTGDSAKWSVLSGAGKFDNNKVFNSDVSDLGYGTNEFRWTVYRDECSQSASVEIIYNAFISYAGPDQEICYDTTTLAATDPDIGLGKWTILKGSVEFIDENAHNTRIIKIKVGENNLRWTVSKNGYDATDDVIITNNNFLISAGDDKESCNNFNKLEANDPGTGIGVWSIDGGAGNFQDNNQYDTDITHMNPGINKYVWTVDRNNCVSTDTVEVVYNVSPVAKISPDIDEGCAPLKVVYTNNTEGAATYEWNTGDFYRIDNSLTSLGKTYENDRNVDSTVVVRLVATSDKGCNDTTFQSVVIHPLPKINFDVRPKEQKFPNSTVNINNITDDGYKTYFWDYGDGSSKVNYTRQETSSHTYKTWGKYVLKLAVFSGHCSDTIVDTVLIIPSEPLTDNRGSKKEGCVPYTLNFTAGASYAISWAWSFGDGAKSDIENPEYIYDIPGTYHVTLYASGDGGSDVFLRRDTIVVHPVPKSMFTVAPDSIMLPNQPIRCFNYSDDGVEYTWDFGNSDTTYSDFEPVYYYTKAGTYNITLSVRSEYGCFDSTTVSSAVTVEPPGEVIMPSAFTPNQSGATGNNCKIVDIKSNVNYLNDIFCPESYGVIEYKLRIYTRQGEQIYESNDIDIGWDGFRKGELAPQGVYVWHVTGKYKNGLIFKKTGNVTLLR